MGGHKIKFSKSGNEIGIVTFDDNEIFTPFISAFSQPLCANSMNLMLKLLKSQTNIPLPTTNCI